MKGPWIPAFAGMTSKATAKWIPTFAGMTATAEGVAAKRRPVKREKSLGPRLRGDDEQATARWIPALAGMTSNGEKASLKGDVQSSVKSLWIPEFAGWRARTTAK